MPIKKSQIYSSLWSACDELRGGMDASQYKDYILTLLFIKYISDLHKAGRRSLIVVPRGASFDDMYAIRHENDLGDKMNKMVEKITSANVGIGNINVADFDDGNKLGDAGARVVIEDFLDGEEASFIVMVDGKNVLPLASSQDHKRIFDGDQGPNTGGMGAYSPAPCVTPEVHAKAMREIILPTVRGMAADGIPFTGFLYAGLMIGKDGSVKTLEFNCRMGDPETQPILMRLKSDFVDLLEHGIDGTLDQVEAEWDRRIALGVVLAAANYPDTPQKGDVIGGLPKANSFGDDCHVFHAGTANLDSKVVTNGGRVLCVTALGENVKLAQKRAYEAVAQIGWEGMQFRKDIGHRALNR